jgi:hypothetical protein
MTNNLAAVHDSDEPFDPYDPEKMRIDAVADVDVEKILTAVPVRKPNRNEFFRVNAEPGYVTDTLVLERVDGLDRETYLVMREVRDLVAHELRRVRLFTAISKRGTLFLWAAKLPREDSDAGRRWAETALQAAEEGKKLWVKMVGNRDLGGYEIFRAKGDLGEPQWPDRPFRDLIEIAFRDRLIDRADHPVIRELQGEL